MTQLFRIRELSHNEIVIPIDWARKEGWNPGLHDAALFYLADPHGFFIGELNGEPIGTISAVSYGDSFGFLGLYIVKEEFRGKGYGIQLWNKAMEYLGNRNIGLDGVVEQQANYARSGFKMAYRNIRYSLENPETFKGNSAKALSGFPLEEIFKYDRQCFPAERREFLETWIKQPDSLALGIVGENNALAGYGVIRKCGLGHKIGPLFADDETKAEELFLSLCSFAKEGPVFLDVPEPNTKAVAIAEKYGMTKVFETARMCTGEATVIEVDKIFGVTTFELG